MPSTGLSASWRSKHWPTTYVVKGRQEEWIILFRSVLWVRYFLWEYFLSHAPSWGAIDEEKYAIVLFDVHFLYWQTITFKQHQSNLSWGKPQVISSFCRPLPAPGSLLDRWGFTFVVVFYNEGNPRPKTRTIHLTRKHSYHILSLTWQNKVVVLWSTCQDDFCLDQNKLLLSR